MEGPIQIDTSFPPILDIPVEVWVELIGHVKTAQDLVHLSSACKQAKDWTSAHENNSWRNIFQNRFPAFYEIIRREELEEEKKGIRHERNWREISQLVLEGHTKFKLQVFNRENHQGFKMSCYDGEGTYRKEDGQMEIKYLSPLDRTEILPLERCRVVPPSYQNHSPSNRWEGSDKVLPKKGDIVEVQWRSNPSHPYGWWHGEVESVEGNRVKIFFKQFNKDDVFYSISFDQPGMRNMQQGQGSGNYGGFRILDQTERTQWASFSS